MKSIVVSFEPLFYHDTDQAIEIIKSNISEKNKNTADILIGTILIEIIPPHEIEKLVKALNEIQTHSQILGIKDFKLILMPPYHQYKDHLREFDIHYFDYLARITHNAYESQKQRRSDRWNPLSKKLLVVTGIPHRYNRIRLLYKLYKENLLNNDRCIWSFFQPFSEESWKECRRFLSDITENDFSEFMEYAVKTLDGVKIQGAKFAGQTMVDDFSLARETYEDTCLSIIPETHCYPDQPKHDISEKTWRAIINFHPFLIAGTQGNSEYLRSLGYKTFDRYFLGPYDDTDDLENTLNKVIINVKHFLGNLENHKEEITADIEYNYRRFLNMIQEGKDLEKYLTTTYNVDQDDTKEIFHAINYWNLVDHRFLEPLDQKQIKNKNQ